MSLTVRDSMVEVPGGQVFVRQWDAGHNQRLPIILLHDSLGSVELWRRFPKALAQTTNRTVMAYDRLGFGRSSPRTEPPSTHFILEEAAVYFPAVAEGMGLDGYILFGHSVGGAMALCIAAQQPQRCQAVVAESAQCFVEEQTLAGIRAAQRNFDDPAQFSRLSRWHGERARWVLEAWTKIWLSPEFQSWSLEPCLERVDCPVLAIHGNQDEYGSSEFPRRIAQGVRGFSRMQILDSCGHVPHREKENEVLGLVRSLLEELSVP